LTIGKSRFISDVTFDAYLSVPATRIIVVRLKMAEYNVIYVVAVSEDSAVLSQSMS
jgi:hypothetical protein